MVFLVLIAAFGLRRWRGRWVVGASTFLNVSLHWFGPGCFLRLPLMTVLFRSAAIDLEVTSASPSASACREAKDSTEEVRWSEFDWAVALFEQPEH